MTVACSQQMITSARKAAITLDCDALEDIKSFIMSQTGEDGGFRGRSNESDLYYTFFALSSLLALKADIPSSSLEGYLNSFTDFTKLDFIHLSCLARCRAMLGMDQNQEIATQIEQYKTKDGGWNHLHKNAGHSSIYAIYLAMLSLKLDDSSAIINCINKLRTSDGAFANESGMTHGTTTATSAAVIVMSELGAEKDSQAIEWLKEQCCDRGGFLGAPDTPLPDLLSTASAIHALTLSNEPIDNLNRINMDFIDLLWDKSGGFCGSPVDLTPDCEYTFYGLLAIGSMS